MNTKVACLTAVFALALTGCSAAVSSQGTNPPAAGSDGSTPAAKDIFAIGEVIKIDDTEMTVHSAKKWTSPNGYSRPTKGSVHLLVNLTLQNKGSEKVSYNTFDYKVEDADGVQTAATFAIGVPKEMKSGSLAPQGKLTSNLLFEVPTNMKSLKLVMEPSFWSNQQVKVTLTK